ncbi:ABC transporter substrate-binding protein [Streptacidiphilus carbonis]|uniref:ABC transporter substrate-binding protein n=1 Tax=Streptacidiphilus carbonis TaxID=105422 RepID=UPI0005AAF80D|nr:ABC transporter substrate-binding protein [Streptacidiphilus carbonis]
MPRQIPRRSLLAGGTAVLAGALAGCSGGSGSTDGSGSATRSVQTATGAVEVPSAPKRVVVLDTAELDSVLTLGFTPVGASRAAADATLPDYWGAARLQGIASTGTIGAPDLDAIGRLDPDLILSNQTRDGSRYESLAAIAPTVLTATTGYPWRQNFTVHADALNQSASVALVSTGYTQHVSQVIEALGGTDAAKKQQISLVRFVQDEDPRLYATQNFLGTVLADLDLGRPSSQSGQVFDTTLGDPAQLAGLDGTALFYATYGDTGKAGTAAVVGSAAWRALGAVAAHRAFAVDDGLWFQGIGYTGANLVLAQLQRFLRS